MITPGVHVNVPQPAGAGEAGRLPRLGGRHPWRACCGNFGSVSTSFVCGSRELRLHGHPLPTLRGTKRTCPWLARRPPRSPRRPCTARVHASTRAIAISVHGRHATPCCPHSQQRRHGTPTACAPRCACERGQHQIGWACRLKRWTQCKVARFATGHAGCAKDTVPAAPLPLHAVTVFIFVVARRVAGRPRARSCVNVQSQRQLQRQSATRNRGAGAGNEHATRRMGSRCRDHLSRAAGGAYWQAPVVDVLLRSSRHAAGGDDDGSHHQNGNHDLPQHSSRKSSCRQRQDASTRQRVRWPPRRSARVWLPRGVVQLNRPV